MLSFDLLEKDGVSYFQCVLLNTYFDLGCESRNIRRIEWSICDLDLDVPNLWDLIIEMHEFAYKRLSAI